MSYLPLFPYDHFLSSSPIPRIRKVNKRGVFNPELNCVDTPSHQNPCKGQFPIPSASIGKIHSSSLTLIRITLQWDAPVCLYTIPSIVRVFIRIIRLIHPICRYFELIAYTRQRFQMLAITSTLNRSRDLNEGKICEQYREPSNKFA